MVVAALQVVGKKIAARLVGEDRIGGDRIAGSGEEGMIDPSAKVPATLKLSSGLSLSLSLRYGLIRGLIEPLSEDIDTRKDIHGKKTYTERGEGTQTERGIHSDEISRIDTERRPTRRGDRYGEGTDTESRQIRRGRDMGRGIEGMRRHTYTENEL